MKILFLVRSLDRGGAERQLCILAKALKCKGNDVCVAVFYKDGFFKKSLEEAGIQIFSLNKRGRWDIVCFFYRLIALVRAQKPDILHSYMSTSNVLSACFKLMFPPKTKIVWGIRASKMEYCYYDWMPRIMSQLEVFFSYFADLIIANSFFGRDYAIKKGFSSKAFKVIPNGIDTTMFTYLPEEGKQLRDSWGLSGEHKLIGVIGRLDPMKDHRTFLKAAQLLTVTNNDIRFVCVGDGSDEIKKELLRQSFSLGLNDVLLWAGTRDDMPIVYNALDILVSSSCGEGFSNVIGEALACGIPCVVTDVGDSAKIIEGCKICRVVPSGNSRLLADACKQVLDNLTNNVPDELRALISGQYTVHSLVDSFLNITS